MTDAISVARLVKAFGPTRALDGLDLVVRTGEVHGFLGPNGAGKTTTIRILLGLMRADAGTAHLLGGDPRQDATSLHRRLASARSSWKTSATTAAPCCWPATSWPRSRHCATGSRLSVTAAPWRPGPWPTCGT